MSKFSCFALVPHVSHLSCFPPSRFYIESISYLKDNATIELFFLNAKSCIYKVRTLGTQDFEFWLEMRKVKLWKSSWHCVAPKPQVMNPLKSCMLGFHLWTLRFWGKTPLQIALWLTGGNLQLLKWESAWYLEGKILILCWKSAVCASRPKRAAAAARAAGGRHLLGWGRGRGRECGRRWINKKCVNKCVCETVCV